jgi:hypothetical protein
MVTYCFPPISIGGLCSITRYMGPRSNCLAVECRSPCPNVTSWYGTPTAVNASAIRCFSWRIGLPNGSSLGVPSYTPREIPVFCVSRSLSRTVFQFAPFSPKAASKSSAKSAPSVSRSGETITTPIGSRYAFKAFVNSAFCSPVNRRGATCCWRRTRANFSLSACSTRAAIRTSFSLSFATFSLACASAASLVRARASRVVTTMNTAARAAIASPHNIRLFQKSAALDSCSTCKVNAWISDTFSFPDKAAPCSAAISNPPTPHPPPHPPPTTQISCCSSKMPSSPSRSAHCAAWR